MKKKFLLVLLVLLMPLCLLFSGCTELERVNYNMTKQADNFNICRRVTVWNSRTDKCLFELVAYCALNNNSHDELEIICEIGQKKYTKHLVYLTEYTLYVVEDLSGAVVSPYHYELNFIPEQLQVFTITSYD